MKISKYFMMPAMIAGAIFTIGSISLDANAAPAQYPLFLGGGGVDPNILFVLDDSGSMMFEITPDELKFGDTSFVFPRANNVYGTSDYSQTSFSQVSTVDNNNAYNARTRSPQFNATYYNPSVTYQPWVNSDGSLYPNANPICAWHNPEKAGTNDDCPEVAQIIEVCEPIYERRCSRWSCWWEQVGETCENQTIDATDVNEHARNLTVDNNNYNGNYWSTCSSSGNCNRSNNDKTFWPATYFWHESGNGWSWDDYTQVTIENSQENYTGHGRENRTDCAAQSSCTYTEEIQNFANWYTYYRSRVLAARAGIGRAFQGLPESLRVGFGTINKSSSSVDGINTETILRGVRQFTASNRVTFFDDLYTRNIPASGTPLRTAVDDAGRYYSRTDERGPWSSTPGESGGTDYSCRQSYTILMTDGYWSGGSSYDANTSNARQNVDNSNGPTINLPDSQTYSYTPADPYRDSYSNTLADVAMYYWNRDLRSDIENRVPSSPEDEATWQHMVLFGIGLGVSGTIEPEEAWAAVNDGTAISWPNTSPNNTNCSGSECPARLDDLLHAAINSRGGFFSAQNPQEFADELSNILSNIVSRKSATASAIGTNSTRLDSGTRAYQASFDSNDWSGHVAAYKISDYGALIMDEDGNGVWNSADNGKIPRHNARNIFTTTLSGEAGEFDWSLMSASASDTGITQEILNWLRGDDTNEAPTGSLRARNSVFGDIVNSNPAIDSNTETLYVGANDGMLHAIDASPSSDGGEEKFTYIPSGVLSNLAQLAQPNYEHRYYVDGSPVLVDISENQKILIGTLGAGGRGVFALDVSEPDNFATSDILWDKNHTSSGFGALGYMVGQMASVPVGTWGSTKVAVFGNGVSSGQGAWLFVVNALTGHLVASLQVDASSDNGLAGATLVFDSNSKVAAAYAGDLEGNVWKIDFTNSTSSLSSSDATLLFTAKDSAGNRQPITAPMSIVKHPSGGNIITFGTGRYVYSNDSSNNAVQTAYGIWDKEKLVDSAWQDSWSNTTLRSNLLAQSLRYEETIEGKNWRTITDNSMNWNNYRGWYFDLVVNNNKKGERIIYPAWTNSGTGTVRFTSIVPSVSNDPCEPGSASRWITEVDVQSGGISTWTRFDTNNDGKFDSADTKVVNGNYVPYISRETEMGGSVSSISVGNNDEGILGSEGNNLRIPGGPPRQSWRQLR